MVRPAAERYGYPVEQVTGRLYVGRFAAPTTGLHEHEVREWCAAQHVGGGPIEVHNVHDVLSKVQEVANSKTYRDNPVLVTMKVLAAAGALRPIDT